MLEKEKVSAVRGLRLASLTAKTIQSTKNDSDFDMFYQTVSKKAEKNWFEWTSPAQKTMPTKLLYLAVCYPANTDVFKTSSGRLKKITRRRHNIWEKTSDLRRFEDVWFTFSWRRPIYDVSMTSDLQRLQDVWFTTSWRRLI